MNRFLVDTDVVVDYLRGHPDAIAWFDDCPARPLISVISIAELHAGVKGKRENAALQVTLSAFITVTVDRPTAELAGTYRRKYGPSHGTGLADALIAACAQQAGAELVTLNRKHFPMAAHMSTPYVKG